MPLPAPTTSARPAARPAGPRRAADRGRAFTLVELLVTTAIVVLLMAAISGVFKIAGDTVGAGTDVSAATRDARALDAVFSQDAAAMAADGPALLIRSGRVPAFLNRADQDGDRDYGTRPPQRTSSPSTPQIRTTDLDGNGSELDAVDQIPQTIYGRRNFRVDQLAFFARGRFPRQTGNGSTLVSPTVAPEALIWYGHLRLPIGTAGFDPHSPPGLFQPQVPFTGTATTIVSTEEGPFTAATNPNNFYASDFRLGRMAYPMIVPDATTSSINGEQFLANAAQAIGTNGLLTPQAPSTNNYVGTSSTDNYRRLAAPFSAGVRDTDDGTAVGAEVAERSRYDLAGVGIDGYRFSLQTLVGENPAPGWWNFFMNYRPQAGPIPARPFTPDAVARAAPVLVENAPSFIVEYAGDYFTQTPATGLITAATPDGVTDYILVNGATGERRTRWYGYPRDLNGDGVIAGGNAIGSLPGVTTTNDLLDVVPVRDLVIASGIPTAPYPFTFERDAPTVTDNYAAPGPVVGIGGNEYVAAWGPADTNRPRLLRLTVQVLGGSDAAAAEGQTFEYVLPVP